jgi:hypothetical protein
MTFGTQPDPYSGVLSPPLGSFGTRTVEEPESPEPPKNWFVRGQVGPPPVKEKPAQTQPEPEPTEQLVENVVHGIADLQRNVAFMALQTALVKVWEGVLRDLRNPLPALEDLKTLVKEEAESEQPITPFAYATTYRVLHAAYRNADTELPLPSISPDGEGGIWVEWMRPGRNVRMVIPAQSTSRSYIFHRVDDVPGIDRLSGTTLAELLKTVILTA